MTTLQSALAVAIMTAFAQGASAQQSGGTTSGRQEAPDVRAGKQRTVAMPPGLAKTRVVRGTIASLDRGNRRAELKEANGGTVMIVIGPQVEGFENLRKGDRVTISSSEALALAIAKNEAGDTGEIRQRVDADAVRQDPPGSKPGLVKVGRSTLVANVYQMDRDAGTVTLRGTDGTPVELRLQDVQALRGIDMDDQVVVSYMKASVLSVEPGSMTKQ